MSDSLGIKLKPISGSAQARDPLLSQSRWWPEMHPFKGGNFLTRELNEAEEALIGFVPRSSLSRGVSMERYIRSIFSASKSKRAALTSSIQLVA